MAVGVIIVYREPGFDFYHPKQELRPGPWNGPRILCAGDVKIVRTQMKAAHKAGEIEGSEYKLCQLVYCWNNMTGLYRTQYARRQLACRRRGGACLNGKRVPWQDKRKTGPAVAGLL